MPENQEVSTELAPIKPERTFKSVQDVHEEMAMAKSHAQTYYTLAEQAGRGLTTTEVVDVQRHLDYWTLLKEEEIPRMEKFDEIKANDAHAQLAITAKTHRVGARMGGSAFPITGGQSGYHGSPPVHVRTNLRGFRAENYAGGYEEANEAAYDGGMWLRAMFVGDRAAKDHVRTREHLQVTLDRAIEGRHQSMDAQTVDDDTKGGFLVPTILSRSIIDVRDQYGVIAQNAQNYAMQSEVDNINKRLTGLTIYKPGEDTAITTSEKTWGQLALTAADAYTLTYISHKLMRGSVVDAADQVVNEIGYAFAKQQDLEGFEGDGVGGAPYFGILGLIEGIGTSGHTTTAPTDWTGITADVIAELVALLPSKWHTNAKFYCHRALFAQVLEPIMELRGASKADIGGPTPMQLKGYPIVFSENMPAAAASLAVPLIFGDLSGSMILGNREGVGIAVSEHHRFDYDQIAIRGRMAWDINFHEPGDAGTATGGMVAIKEAI